MGDSLSVAHSVDRVITCCHNCCFNDSCLLHCLKTSQGIEIQSRPCVVDVFLLLFPLLYFLVVHV